MNYIILIYSRFPNIIVTFIFLFLYFYLNIKYNTGLLDGEEGSPSNIYQLEANNYPNELEGDNRYPREHTAYNPNYVETREGYRIELGDQTNNYPAELDDNQIYPSYPAYDRIPNPSHYPRNDNFTFKPIQPKQIKPKVHFEDHHNKTL
jgi:hypothetical protein